ncbi:MAG: phosphoribosyl-AMP cyclohydrolase [Candidatus Rokubacteria bacterium]|nr:phosphoribosyl-AMP cyclohydrolase [Candidatus Rokubacteria bacterium]
MGARWRFDTKLDFGKLGGLVPVVIQHADTREILMVGFMNEEAWQKTLETGRVTLFRRTLGRVWVKGEDDGHYVDATEILIDCDDDSVIVRARPTGNLCGHGYPGCFIHEATPAGA